MTMKGKLVFFLLCMCAAVAMAGTPSTPNLRKHSAQEALNLHAINTAPLKLDMTSGTTDSTWAILTADSTATQLLKWSIYSSAAEAAITIYYKETQADTLTYTSFTFPVLAGMTVEWNPSPAVDSVKVDRTSATRVILLGVY